MLASHVGGDLELGPQAGGALWILVPVAGAVGDGPRHPSGRRPDIGCGDLDDVVPAVAVDVVAEGRPGVRHARVDLGRDAGHRQIVVSIAVDVLAGRRVVAGGEGTRVPALSSGDVQDAVVVEVTDGDALGEETVVNGDLGVLELAVLGTAGRACPFPLVPPAGLRVSSPPAEAAGGEWPRRASPTRPTQADPPGPRFRFSRGARRARIPPPPRRSPGCPPRLWSRRRLENPPQKRESRRGPAQNRPQRQDPSCFLLVRLAFRPS